MPAVYGSMEAGRTAVDEVAKAVETGDAWPTLTGDAVVPGAGTTWACAPPMVADAALLLTDDAEQAASLAAVEVVAA